MRPVPIPAFVLLSPFALGFVLGCQPPAENPPASGTPGPARSTAVTTSLTALPAPSADRPLHALSGPPLVLPAGLEVQVSTDPSHRGGIDSGKLPVGRERWRSRVGRSTGEAAYVDGRIFLVSVGSGFKEWDRFESNPRRDEREGVYGLDAKTGAVEWQRAIGVDPSGPLVVGKDTLFVAGPEALFALKTSDGEQRWSFALSAPAPEALALSGTHVFAATNTRLVALTQGEGDVSWEWQAPSRILSLLRVEDTLYVGTQYATPTPGSLFALDAKTGAERWRYDAGAYARVRLPAFEGDRLFFTDESHLHCLDAKTGKNLWIAEFPEREEPNGAYVHNPLRGHPLVVGGVVFIGRDYRPGDVYAVDASTGKERWRSRPFPAFARGSVESSLSYADGRLYVGTSGWRVNLGNNGHTQAHFLSVFAAADGAPLWNVPEGQLPAGADSVTLADGAPRPGERLSTTPLVVAGHVFVGREDGHFYAYE
jgi:outer membrane protein assembly factor BamB